MLEKLRKLREKSSVTQKQLAEAIGVSQQSINKYENHNIEPDIETLIRIADYFDTSVDCLIGHDTIPCCTASEHFLTLTPEEEKIILKYRNLNPQQRRAVACMMDSYEIG